MAWCPMSRQRHRAFSYPIIFVSPGGTGGAFSQNGQQGLRAQQTQYLSPGGSNPTLGSSGKTKEVRASIWSDATMDKAAAPVNRGFKDSPSRVIAISACSV